MGGRNIWKLLYVLISAFLYALLMEPVGFLPVSLLLFLFIPGVIRKKQWLVAILTSNAVTMEPLLRSMRTVIPTIIMGKYSGGPNLSATPDRCWRRHSASRWSYQNGISLFLFRDPCHSPF
ncbi:MAG: hypothetical protein A2156_08035 [Deltaproteobacteria bacterium RBG_16_48_10]|nr:MAG: hypothetical protein A2156_08035 [Deltaproteobacteria bacterium RBG_16_48_10]